MLRCNPINDPQMGQMATAQKAGLDAKREALRQLAE
jgi:hypothetical protein